MAAVAMVIFAGTAMAATIDTQLGTYEKNCTACHPKIADSKSSEIIFSHGYHLRIDCAYCHTSFAHREDGTTVVPKMKDCFDCHGLRHSSQGIIADAKCESCHRTPRAQLRPTSHTFGWAGKAHAAPGAARLTSECSMCHTRKQCDACHRAKNVKWKPSDGRWAFDPQNGCLACHSNETLTKTVAGKVKSYKVTGLEDSAHRSITCPQCHQDYKYDDSADRTEMWNVNAGLACQGCHQHKGTAQEYLKSVHGQLVAEGKWEVPSPADKTKMIATPTCASCHGGHDIQRLDSAVASAALHASSEKMCARCHPDKYASYDDYYHGAAYKRGASDAPACWQCHGSHDVQPSSVASAMTSDKNIAATCGQKGCHKGTEQFGAGAGDLIHQKTSAYQNNALVQLIGTVRSWVNL
jgi:hypothetical protein